MNRRRPARGGARISVALAALAAVACEDCGEPAPATYVGREACAGCHGAETERWAGSHHDLAMQEASEATVLGDFDDATFVYGDVTSTFLRRDGGHFVRTDGPEGTLREYPVAYTFGAMPLQQYLIPLEGGRYQVLGIAWDARPESDGGQRWFHLYPGGDVDASSPLHWTRPAQGWNAGCAVCHSTGLERGFDLATRSWRTTWSEIDVSCEACHGPGSGHVRLARDAEAGGSAVEGAPDGLVVALGDPERAWVRAPGEATASLASGTMSRVEVETCAACHARRAELGDHTPGDHLLDAFRPSLLRDGLYHADGQIEDEVYVWGSFVQSRMYAAGVTCSDCHDPHGLEPRAAGNALCARCHDGARFDTTSHHFHDETSDGARCVECHMPATTYMGVDPRRDHALRIPRPDLTRDIGAPHACNRCHADRSPEWAADAVARRYGPPPEGQFARAIHGGRAADPSAFAPLVALAADTATPAIVRGTALSLLGGYPRPETVPALRAGLADPEPLARLGALEGLGAIGDAAVLGLAYPLLEDPLRAIRVEAARLSARIPPERTTPEQAAAVRRGVAEYEDIQRRNADRPASWIALGDLHSAQGRAADAEAAYRTALSLDSTDVVAHLNLADLQRALGRDDIGEEVLRRALAARPDAPEVHHALGLLLVRRGDLEGALPWLERAAERSEVARFAYVYGVASASAGDVEGGARVLEEALGRHPFDREILAALAVYARELGRTEDAIRYAERLVAVLPEDPGARALLAEVGGPAR